MKVIFCVALSLIVGNFNVVQSAIGRAGETNGDNEITEFGELDLDCMRLIFDYIDFRGLLNMARVNDQYSSLSADIYRRKYSHLPIFIDNFEYLEEHQNELLNVAGMDGDADKINPKNYFGDYTISDLPVVNETEIDIRNGDDILNTFRHFGHFIKRIKSQMNLGNIFRITFRPDFIGKLINKFSSESLVELDLQFNAELILNQIANPLINVESVTISEANVDADLKQQTSLTELFPAVRRLNMIEIYDLRAAYFDCHMPNLEYLHLDMHDRFFDSGLPGVITKNLQIQSIKMPKIKSTFLKRVSMKLPHLKTLEIPSSDLLASIRFENVITFIYHTGSQYTDSLSAIYFPRLETFQVNKAVTIAEFNRFLLQHKHLKRLHLTIDDITDLSFQQISANLNDIVELTLDTKFSNDALSANVILQFLASHDNVKQLNVNIPTDREDELRELLEPDWDVQTNGAGLSFIRKMNQ